MYVSKLTAKLCQASIFEPNAKLAPIVNITPSPTSVDCMHLHLQELLELHRQGTILPRSWNQGISVKPSRLLFVPLPLYNTRGNHSRSSRDITFCISHILPVLFVFSLELPTTYPPDTTATMPHLAKVTNDADTTKHINDKMGEFELGPEDNGDFGTSVYGSKFTAMDIPKHEMPEGEMPRDIAYRLIK